VTITSPVSELEFSHCLYALTVAWHYLSVGFAEPCRLQRNKRVGKYANRVFCGKRDKKWVTSSKSYARRDLFNDV